MSDRVLKAGWTKVKFGEVVRHVKDKVDAKPSGLKWYIAGEHMDTDDLRIRRRGEINDDYLGPAFHMCFKPGQVLYGSRRTYLRKVAVADFEGICANTTFVLEPKDPEVLLPELLPFIMQTESFHEHSIQQSRGSVNPYVNFSDIDWYEFALPPLAEQRRIAEVLGAMEETLEETINLQARLDRLRQSFIINTFSQFIDNKRVSFVRVEDVGKVLMGRQRSPKYDQGISPRPYLRVANVFDGYIDTTNVKQMDFSNNEFERYKLEAGDVLLNEGQSRELVGRSSIFHDEVKNCCFQNTLLRFRAYKVSPEYAHHYFQFCLYTGRFAKIAKQTTSIAHLGATRFASMPFPVVSPEIEKSVVTNLTSIESNLTRVAIRKDQLEQIKNIVLSNVLSV